VGGLAADLNLVSTKTAVMKGPKIPTLARTARIEAALQTTQIPLFDFLHENQKPRP